jgi:hypothetical protein
MTHRHPVVLPSGRPKIRGLGDLVATVAEPVRVALIASKLGAFTRTLKDCGGCERRKEMLNRLVPFR